MRLTLIPSYSGISKQLSSLQPTSKKSKRYLARMNTLKDHPDRQQGSAESSLTQKPQELRSDRNHQVTITGATFADRAIPPHFSHQPLPAKSIDQLTPSIPDSQQRLIDFLESLELQDFHATLVNFNRLSVHQKSRLSGHVYDSLFSLASRILEDDKLIITHQSSQPENDRGLSSTLLSIESGTQNQPYSIDHCRVQDRLTRVDELFHSVQRALSTEQLHFYLQNNILAAALELRRSHQSSESQNSIDHRKELYLKFREQISSIIARIPSLHQIPIPTADQLAGAIPHEILGLYSRFLVIFHQPNQGLKLMRKIFYGYLIGRRQKLIEANENQEPQQDPRRGQTLQPSILSATETGSLIISLLRHKIHHRLAALKLAVRMITMGGIYPDQVHLSSLLRRMYMSKPEWESTIEFVSTLPDQSASFFLQNQIAIVEAEDRRVERVLELSAKALELPAHLQGDFLAPATLSSEIFAHSIQALIDNSSISSEVLLPSGLRGAIAIRTRMLELGILPEPESDDLILRRICSIGRRIVRVEKRHEFLSEMIGGMFPTSKIVPIRTEPMRSFKFASHPGKSPEAFRLMRWMMESNELELSLQLFQSISRYGYVSSLTSIPFSYLRRLMEKALHSHPELAMELYQHLHMSGSDRSGELFGAVKVKSIEMGDYRLAEYLLKISDDQDPIRQAERITSFITGFSRRRASPGNVSKTLSLFDLVWTRWSSSSIENKVWFTLLDQIQKLGPLKLAQRPELKPQINQVIKFLNQSQLDTSELNQIKKSMIELIEVSLLIQQDYYNPVPSSILNSHSQKLQSPIDLHHSVHQIEQLSSIQSFEDLIEHYLRENRVDKAIQVCEKAIEVEIMIKGPIIGKLLNRLVDDLKHIHSVRNPSQTDHSLLDNRKSIVDRISHLNQNWRANAWKVSLNQRGSDQDVVRAMDRFYQLIQ
ncbi:hypothetical protein MJO29_008178 [Puccinia striiformis f. sp. tritici]|nr:hypothetical protein Pst134EB_016773 [Puccinia striiformis f. sp. tritici]KAI7952547.1 hypothetical protein MJO29_008178 [Puccinia striiformis f. sp. tritici]